jgi:outer membrane protein TolC
VEFRECPTYFDRSTISKDGGLKMTAGRWRGIADPRCDSKAIIIDAARHPTGRRDFASGHLWLLGALLFTGAIGCQSTPFRAAGSPPAAVSTARPIASPVDVGSPPLAGVGSGPNVQLAQYVESIPPPGVRGTEEEAPAETYPIDLASALRLGGANSLQIRLASERIRQARARLEGAQYQWLPSLNAGVGYNRHTGRVQDTRGEIVETDRNALFVGGGPNVGPGPLTGPGGPPARLFLGLPVTDVLFAPLAERQQVAAAGAGRDATFNDALLEVSVGYLELVQAQGQVAIADEATKNAAELSRLVDSRVDAGVDAPADGLRIQAELADRRRQQALAREGVGVTSAELVRLLRLDPAVLLFPLEDEPVPFDLVSTDVPLPALLELGISSRPELRQHRALVQSTLTRLRQERWRPWLPTAQVGLSAGGFGGGEDGAFGNFGGRTDFDALLVWELRNLGFGNAALSRERASQNRQAQLGAEQVRDTIASQIARAYYQARFRERQIDAARDQVAAATEALPLNMQGIVGGELRAIEAQQAIQALALARSQYLSALIDYNRAQFQLLRAIGQPPNAGDQFVVQGVDK